MWGSAVVLRSGNPEGDAADRFIAGLPIPAAEPAALVAEKLDLILRFLRQLSERLQRLVQAEIRHHEAEFRPRELMTQIGEIRQYLRGRGDEIELRIVGPEIVDQQIGAYDHAVFRCRAFRKQTAQCIAGRILQMLRLKHGITEGESRRDTILPHERPHLLRGGGAIADAPATPDCVAWCTIDRADPAPVVEVRPMRTVQREKAGIELVVFEQAGQMKPGFFSVFDRHNRSFHPMLMMQRYLFTGIVSM